MPRGSFQQEEERSRGGAAAGSHSIAACALCLSVLFLLTSRCPNILQVGVVIYFWGVGLFKRAIITLLNQIDENSEGAAPHISQIPINYVEIFKAFTSIRLTLLTPDKI